MGWNSTIIVCNDSLTDIENDPNFGKNLSRQISSAVLPPEHRENRWLDVSAGNSVNAAQVIETHHADGYAVTAVGGNTGHLLGTVWPYGDGGEETRDYRILKALADQMGYQLRKKPKKPGRKLRR